MAGSHKLLSKNDRALVAWIIAQGAGTANNTFPAKSSLNKPLPCVIVWSESGKETPLYSGTYLVDVCVMVKTAASVDTNQDPSQPPIDSDNLVGAVFDCLHTDLGDSAEQLAQEITNAAHAAGVDGYTCQNIILIGPEAAFAEHGAAWVDSFKLQMLVCPSNQA